MPDSTDPNVTAARDSSASAAGSVDETAPMAARAAAPKFAPPSQPGEVGTLGPYRVVKELGKGGMGAVYLAVDTRLDRKLALKVMLPEFAANREAKERFLREAKSAAKISHDNVVTVFEADERDGTPYIAMQFLQGYPLDEYLKNKGTPPLAHVIRIVREAALGLAAAHELGLVHRDIKPGNLWLEAPNGRVKVLDFGLAKPVGSEAELTSTGAVVGTPAYMSPEQARGVKVDARTDLFSLGALLYRLCTGRTPFNGPNVMAVLMALGSDDPTPVRELNPNVPESLAALIHQLLAKNPGDRPQTALEVAEWCRAIADRLAAPAPAPADFDTTEPDGEPAPVAIGRGRRGVWVAGAGLVLAVATAGLFLANRGRTEPTATARADATNPPPAVPTKLPAVPPVKPPTADKPSPDKPPVVNPSVVDAPAEADSTDPGDKDYRRGLDYANGRGVLRDYVKAREWYEKAAAQGHTGAQNNLGVMYVQARLGSGPDYAKAREWFERAAERGHPYAQLNLAVLYDDDRFGTGPDYAKAKEWYEKAAAQGNAHAQNNLGLMYDKGRIGGRPDYAKAREWYEKAAARGFPPAQYNLGWLHASDRFGTGPDYAKAREWYEKAAAQGHVIAQNNLGWMYAHGHIGPGPDHVKAREWYEKAAAQGFATAQNHLGILYEHGRGVERDYVKAREWYEKSAAQGHAAAQSNLGALYYNGLGVGNDVAKAQKWLELAAAQGYSIAMHNLGMLHEQRTPADLKLALEWYEKAAALGHAKAKEAVARLKKGG